MNYAPPNWFDLSGHGIGSWSKPWSSRRDVVLVNEEFSQPSFGEVPFRSDQKGLISPGLTLPEFAT